MGIWAEKQSLMFVYCTKIFIKIIIKLSQAILESEIVYYVMGKLSLSKKKKPYFQHS